MDMMTGDGASFDGPESAFSFDGTWREFAPIAFTNLLLTIVTLGIYRFWAKTRERRYLWSRTSFIGDPLEWMGTGKEMFIGFLIVMAVIVPTFFMFSFGFEALLLRGHYVIAPLLIFAFYFGIFYLVGVALFRALRYRLSRTYWRGIRGGSDVRGWRYGWSYLWKTIGGGLALGLLVPWSMVELWNDRWNSMSFGQYEFNAGGTTDRLLRRWVLIYLAALVGSIIVGVVMVGAGGGANPADMGSRIVPLLIVYPIIGLAALVYYAAYYRNVVSGLSLAGLDFTFNARTADWFRLMLGSVALVICTLGVGAIFLSYRNWSFFIRHLGATGEIDLDTLSQSTTRSASDAEGLATAFDIGAI